MKIGGCWKILQMEFFISISFVFFYFCQISQSLKCHDCTTIQGMLNFEKDCAKKPAPSTLKDGFAGCFKLQGLTDNGTPFVLRSGHLNAQVAGRVPSCYHPEQEFQLNTHVGAMTFDTIMKCWACDDIDGCNGSTSNFQIVFRKKCLNFLIVVLFVAFIFIII